MSFTIQGIVDRLNAGIDHHHDLMVSSYCLWSSWLVVSQMAYVIPALEDYGYAHGNEFDEMLEALRDAAGRLCDAVFDGMPLKRLFDGIEEPPPALGARLGTAKDVMLRMIAAGLDGYTAGILQKETDLCVDILIDDFDQLDELAESPAVGDWARRWRAHIRRLAYQLENVR